MSRAEAAGASASTSCGNAVATRQGAAGPRQKGHYVWAFRGQVRPRQGEPFRTPWKRGGTTPPALAGEPRRPWG